MRDVASGFEEETMPGSTKGSRPPLLRYADGKRKNAAATRKEYLLWRAEQDPPLPVRCDNAACQFHNGPLVWNDQPLTLILDHENGVNTDNRPKNLRLLCPACD